jgi:hypothetical protein
MKNISTALVFLGGFLAFSAFLFGLQWFLAEKNVLVLDYKIHFLIFFVTLISLLTLSVVFLTGKKNIIGFAFLGFVIFKIFAIAYIAVFQEDFKLHVLPYFALYWIYLVVEVFFVIKLLRKQD